MNIKAKVHTELQEAHSRTTSQHWKSLPQHASTVRKTLQT
jgi:hypothetical protein